jgi:hypothetical protein
MDDGLLSEYLERVLAKVESARRQRAQPFGSEHHQWVLNPVASEAEVAAFESTYGVVLPADYRAFVCTIGNGGAGPAYGLIPLADSLGQEQNTGQSISLTTLFPYDESWREPSADDDLAALPGALALCHEGCGYYHLLVVTGSSRGHMWLDGRVSDQGVEHFGMTFLSWYERWLDHVLDGENGIWWLT